MRYRAFTFSIPPPEDFEELNDFLASRKILSVRTEVVRRDDVPYLLFLVEFLESGKSGTSRPPKVDYREKFSDEEFVAFSRLRDVRKVMAEQEGVPVYAVMTNAQLAEIVEKRMTTLEGLLSISGVGQAKVDKYGPELLKVCSEHFKASEKETPVCDDTAT